MAGRSRTKGTPIRRRRALSGALDAMDTFLLMLIGSGFSTVYELLAFMDMSVNSTGPRLKKMQRAGLLNCVRGSRNRIAYDVTAKGQELLATSLSAGAKEHWRFGKSHTSATFTRALALAWVHGGTQEALSFIAEAAKDFRNDAEDKTERAFYLRRRVAALSEEQVFEESEVLIQHLYQWLGTEFKAASARLELKALDDLTSILKESRKMLAQIEKMRLRLAGEAHSAGRALVSR
jgi:DNA-binding PadR family transcriptional regulator